MRVEIVFNKDDFFRIGKHRVTDEAERGSVVESGSSRLLRDEYFTNPHQRSLDHESGSGPVADILIIITSRCARL